MIYQWKNGAHQGKVSAQLAGDRLDTLRKTHGQLTATIAVEDARPKDSVLHPVFEWSDKLAAEQYRLTQARELIRSVVMVPEGGGDDARTIRAFVVINEFGEQGYTSTYVALADPSLRAQVLARALRELRQFEQKYQELDELADVFKASKLLRGNSAA